MLAERLHPANDGDIIYHYCSPQAFLSIIENRTIRFSDINLLNDAEEGRWGYDVFLKSANRILNRKNIPETIPEIPEWFIDEIDKIWHNMGFNLASFISCFSTDGDSLSQWRAYADDGRGFSIGFKAPSLRALPIQMLSVEYDIEQQLKEMIIAISATYLEFEDKGRDHTQSWFFDRCATLAASSIAFKNPAFRDEKEIRCQHVVNVKRENGIWSLEDTGGVSDGKAVAGQPVQFQERRGTITPFIDMPLRVTKTINPIHEIVLGPKCLNAPGNIMLLLGNNGYGVVSLRSAGAAYR